MTGYDSKRQMAADKLQEPINLLEARKIAAEYGTPDSQIDSGNLYFALMKCLEHIDAQPAQEQTLLDAIVGGTGVMLGDKRIDPASIYRQPAQEPTSGDYALGYAEGFNDACKKPAQEPVAPEWYHGVDHSGCNRFYHKTEVRPKEFSTQLYTAPPQRKWVRLTPEDILALFDQHNLYGSKLVEFARAVERKIRSMNK